MPKLLAVTGKFIKSVTFIGYEEGKAKFELRSVNYIFTAEK